MAELTTEHIFRGSIDETFAAIRQFERYPQYLPGVTHVEILPAKTKGSICQVRYEIKIIKSFYYTLDMFEEKNTRLWWHLADSNLMKSSNGAWTLRADSPTTTKATYNLDIAFSGFVPGKLVDQVTKANLPAMFEGFQKLINDLQRSQKDE